MGQQTSGSGTPIAHGAGGGHPHHSDHRSLAHWWARIFWWTVFGVALGFAVPFLVRFLFGMDPLWNKQVTVAMIATFSGLGFVAGAGCFDWWWAWLRGKKVDYDDHSFHGATSWRDYFRLNTDHKVIGAQYLGIIFFFMVVAGALAELVRTELAQPGSQITNGEGYNTLFTGHAALMIFLVLIPAFAGLANFALPIMIGAKDMAFPKFNALSVWMLPPAGILILLGVMMGGYSSGWTAYVPLAVQGETGTTLFEVGVQFAGFSSIFTAVNFLVTIFTMRAPGMSIWRMPLLVWANATTSFLVVFGTPFVAVSQFMTLFDRIMGTHFFNWAQGGDVISYQHIFWFYSHPAVYIMLIPGFGIISEVVATFARKPIFGYRAIAFSTMAIAVLGFGVWAHHMFVSGMAPWLRIPMMAATMLIAIPTGIKVFSWLGTLWRGRIHLQTPMLWALGFIITFVIGGLSGVFVAILPVDIFATETYYVVAHIHYVFFGGSVFTIFAGVYYWFPKMTGRMYSENLGKWHFWLTFIGFNATFLPMHWLGLVGMPRRVVDYDPRFANLNLFISIASILMVVGTIVFFVNMWISVRSGAKAPWNPWRGRTLEWLVSSPPPLFNFDRIPQVVGGPYQYGHEGARHAIIYAPDEVGGGEVTETDRPTIMVVASDTVASQPVLDAIRELNHSGHWRFSLVAPVSEGAEADAAQRRQRLATAVLEESDVVVDARTVTGEPVAALTQAAKDVDAHEILFATHGLADSEWLKHDLVDRVRKASGIALSHITVSIEESGSSAGASGMRHLHVLAPDGVDSSLANAIVSSVDDSPARVTISVPTGDANAAPNPGTVAALMDALDGLRARGVAVRGDVRRGTVIDAARAITQLDRPDGVLIGGTPSDDEIAAITKASRRADVRALTGGVR